MASAGVPGGGVWLGSMRRGLYCRRLRRRCPNRHSKCSRPTIPVSNQAALKKNTPGIADDWLMCVASPCLTSTQDHHRRLRRRRHKDSSRKTLRTFMCEVTVGTQNSGLAGS